MSQHVDPAALIRDGIRLLYTETRSIGNGSYSIPVDMRGYDAIMVYGSNQGQAQIWDLDRTSHQLIDFIHEGGSTFYLTRRTYDISADRQTLNGGNGAYTYRDGGYGGNSTHIEKIYGIKYS